MHLPEAPVGQIIVSAELAFCEKQNQGSGSQVFSLAKSDFLRFMK